MLKIRLQGTIEDIKWFQEYLENSQNINLIEFSQIFGNKGTKKYYRVYAEIEKVENHGGNTNE